jgi:hypothetical protein
MRADVFTHQRKDVVSRVVKHVSDRRDDPLDASPALDLHALRSARSDDASRRTQRMINLERLQVGGRKHLDELRLREQELGELSSAETRDELDSPS